MKYVGILYELTQTVESIPQKKPSAMTDDFLIILN